MLVKAVINRLFKFRPRSEHEIIAKLKEKKFESGIIDEVVLLYKNCGLIDDANFAKGWITSRLNKPMGFRRIRQELREKGVQDEIIDAQLAEAKTKYDETGAVSKIAQKRLKYYQGLDNLTKKRRLEGYLLRRGFSAEAVYKVIYKNI